MRKSFQILLDMLFIATFVYAAHGIDQQNENITNLINSIYNNNNYTTKSYDRNSIEITGCSSGSECVKYFLCKDNLIIKDGKGIFDIRFNPNDKRECADSLERCCRISEISEESLTHPGPTSEGCGFRNVDGLGLRISGDLDNQAQFSEFPWMVAILREEKKCNNKIVNTYLCGGSLIHPSVVLTAAHCVDRKPAKLLKIRAGEWDTQTQNEILPHQDRMVDEVVSHEHYNRGTLANDIALLFLATPVDLASNVKPICLPPAQANFDHSRCFASGWGKDVFGNEGKYEAVLKRIDLPIVPRDICQSIMRRTRPHYELHSSFICAGGEIGKDTCQGDGGSPLVCPISGTNKQYYQAGIVAWGIGCSGETPGLYANIPELRGWLDEKLKSKNIDSKFYTP